MNARATRRCRSARRHASTVAAIDWPRVRRELDAQGAAVIDELLTPDACRALAALYAHGTTCSAAAW